MAKPSEWESMTSEEKRKYAFDLFVSPRGQYLMSQALEYAIAAMRAVPEPYTEHSNIEDLEMMREGVWNLPDDVVDPKGFAHGERGKKEDA